MIPSMENSRQYKLICNDRLVISWGLEDQGGTEEIAKGYKETSVCDRYVPSLDHADSFMGAHKCQNFII